jgi:D-apiose dehydrogenase
LTGKRKAENTGDDNFETMRMVWAAYESAKTGKVIKLSDFT